MQGGKLPEDQQKHWDSTYAQTDFFGAEPSELGISALELFRKEQVRNVLEIGCGQGRDTWFFVRNGLEVIALDYSETGVCQMQERAKDMKVQNQITLKVHDARLGIPLADDSVDAIFSHMFFCMELSENQLESIFEECLRVLRPGGINLYSVRNEHDPHYRKFVPKGEDMYQNPMGFVVHFFDPERIKRLAEGYELMYMKEFDDTSPPFVKKLYEVALRKPRA